jgi:hypothetical protein
MSINHKMEEIHRMQRKVELFTRFWDSLDVQVGSAGGKNIHVNPFLSPSSSGSPTSVGRRSDGKQQHRSSSSQSRSSKSTSKSPSHKARKTDSKKRSSSSSPSKEASSSPPTPSATDGEENGIRRGYIPKKRLEQIPLSEAIMKINAHDSAVVSISASAHEPRKFLTSALDGSVKTWMLDVDDSVRMAHYCIPFSIALFFFHFE